MNLAAIFSKHHESCLSEPYPSLKKRYQLLREIKRVLQQEASQLVDSVNQDFSHRSKEETLFLEIFPAIKAADYCIKHLKAWTKPQKKSVPLYLQPSKASVIAQPLGVVGIIVPWNYPIYLSMVPLIYALAAGNRVMIKFSEFTPVTGNKINDLMMNDALFFDMVSCHVGDVALSKEFTALPFGHLLFTGSTRVGKEVMAAASQHLTPVTLELGGKSPVIISTTCNDDYFDRLFMGKLFNAGQTCVAPDYLLIPKQSEALIEKQFIAFMLKHYPDLMNNENYTSIITLAHKNRLNQLALDAKDKGARIVQFGEESGLGNNMPVYLLFNVNDSMLIMNEEIFGPLLPVITYHDFSDAVASINARPNPLALYYFGNDKKEINQLKYGTLSGALTINDTLMHIANNDLPFGGVGQSGLGHYHGQEGFLTFSKIKPIFIQRRISPVSWFYPPYGRLIRYFIRCYAGIHYKGES